MSKIQLPKSGKKYRRIGQKVGNMVVIMQIVSVIFAVGMCTIMFRSLATGMLKERCTNGTNMLAYVLSQTDGTEDKNKLLDELESRMGCQFTIFEGDTRAYTTVVQNGQRVVGTKLSDKLSNIVLQQGQSYVGRATILNEEYLCSYVPTRDADGKVDGLIFAGISSAEANRQILITIILSTIVSIAVIAVCILVMSSLLKKTVSYPLAEITQVADRLAHGDLGLTSGEDIQISVHSNDEVGTLGQIFDETIRRMRSYIGEISSVLDSISNGDLTNTAQQEYVGDFASIRRSLDSIGDRLNSTVGQIRESAEQVSTGAQSLAQGATEQASSVEELSATISDISENAHRTAQATREAGQFVEQAGAQLGISVEYVKNLNLAMERISSSSQEISKIIAAIENIAFQTNILALNAAVEAARAGSAGKGFAVVADEVRNLANKSDEAAKATKDLIESSIAAVTEGSDVVSKVTQSLERTSESAGGVTAKMSIVVEEVESQTVSISQITEGIDQISGVVQNNSATSEQPAAASEELSSQASLLKNLVSSFRLKRDARW